MNDRDEWLEDDLEDEVTRVTTEEKVQKLHHFEVRFDYASSKEAYEQRLLYLLLHPRHSRVYFLTFGFFWGALFSRRRRELLEESSLLLLQSPLLSWGIYWITGLHVPIWTYADFYDCLAHFRERYSLSFYVWGGETSDVRTILKQFTNYQNPQNSFSGGHPAVAGSDTDSFENILTSLGKLHPNFLLIGEGYHFDFLYENQKRIIANVALYSPPMFRLMASNSSFDRKPHPFKFLLEGLVNFLRNPFRIFSWMRNLSYVFMVLISRILGSRD